MGTYILVLGQLGNITLNQGISRRFAQTTSKKSTQWIKTRVRRSWGASPQPEWQSTLTKEYFPKIHRRRRATLTIVWRYKDTRTDLWSNQEAEIQHRKTLSLTIP